ncbi:MAG: histidine phosphatase family protein [Giesbergeria sp.]
MNVPRLWLVRHAPVLAPPGICYGQLNLPADQEMTARCAESLANELPHGSVLHHSTLQRCELLAELIHATRPDLILIPDMRLQELDFGVWEGQPWAALPRADIDAWAAQLPTFAPGGGERLIDMLIRVNSALQEARAEAHETHRDVVWVAHAGVARCVQWLLGAHARAGRVPCSAHWPVQAPAPGAWALYDLNLLSPDAEVRRS